MMNRRLTLLLLTALTLPLVGCPTFGPAPETVEFVDLEQYAGLWYEIASNPVFFNEDLVGVTAEYTLNDDGTVKVVNKGFEGSLDGPMTSIEGVARVRDEETNAKLGVSFSSVPGSRFFEGEYWIIALDENYEWAVVSDSRQMTLFILSRTPSVSVEFFNGLVEDLDAADIDTSRLEITGMVE